MANLIRVIGVGPGDLGYITPAALELIKNADILVGGERVLQPFKEICKAKEFYVIRNNLSEMVEFIKTRCQDSGVAVLASGDPGFFGILEYLKRHFQPEELVVLPGLSSVQLACARLCTTWHDAAFYSVHGRGMEGLAELVRANAKVIVLTDPRKTPAVIAAELAAAGLAKKKFFVCENLSYSDEQIREYDSDNIPADAGKSGCVLVITDKQR